MEIVQGMGLLIATLGVFSLFSLKAPKGQAAMGGLANAAIATFLVEAIHRYIAGNFLHSRFLGEVGSLSGSMGAAAAAMLVLLEMGISPVLAVSAGLATAGFGILPGFIAGYLLGLLTPKLEKKLPEGLNVILMALLLAPLARGIAAAINPMVSSTLSQIGAMISAAAEQSPYVMGILLGGIMKVICTSPLSSMALTAMLGLTGLPMGIAAVATFGGTFTNGVIFYKLKLGSKGNIIAVMLEPLTQAHIVTRHAVPIYVSDFFGGALAGLSASWFGIINNAPGTASPIPGFLAPFGFNPPLNVLLAMACAAIGGILGGLIGASLFRNYRVEDPPQDLNPLENAA
ncbi:PTS sugar transporter subunit IIC [Proteiniclasticum sp. QWL-01]|uniref:PTS sugar transporter subunit IIC n=1 Tax=Proteiniclasticum sp. QWL-01 TaxID=3036945 RepID=UPI002411787E|nr:PTS sugar transporter subunit IIC [Proteiniclasticum sp. QWL-01]WFF74599.1 PTS sugar transporter subunit IIC [Proteiniclasticum sp. QWL-01]